MQKLSSRVEDGTDESQTLHFSIGSFACNIHFDSRATREAVEPSLAVFYRMKAGAHPSPRITFVLQVHDGSLDLPPGAPINEEIIIVNYPDQYEAGKQWLLEEWVAVFSQKLNILYLLNREAGIVRILGPGPRAILRPFIRAFRLAIRTCLEEMGYRLVHATALVTNSGAVILPGHQGSGKTTLLFDLLQASSARVLAFDKVFLRPFKEGICCVSELSTLGLGIGTAMRFGLFLECFPEHMRKLSPEELWARQLPTEKARILPDVAGRHFPSAPDGPYPLEMIIFPQIDPHEALQFERLTTEEAISMLEAHFLIGATPQNPDWMHLGRQSNRALDDVSDLLRRIARGKDIRYYRLRFGEASAIRSLPSLREAIAC